MLKNSLGSLATFVLASIACFSLQADSSSAIDKEDQLNGVYNQSSMYSCVNSWDIELTADYIYWIWQQSQLTLGTLATPTESGMAGFFNGTQETLFQTPSYASGFQVGLGCNFHGMDDWKFYAGYTWYENTSNENTIVGDSQYLAISETLIKHLRGATPGLLLSRDLQSKIQLQFDTIDALLQRLFYFGRSATATFSMGLKALWVKEEATANGSNLYFIEQGADLPVSLAGSFNSSSRADSWGLGPKIGFQGNWLLGMGFSLIGNFGYSILYTSNTTLDSSVIGQISNVSSSDLQMSQSQNYNVLNAVTETSLGFGWGTYFLNNNFHIDLSASYDFNIYWNRDVLSVLIGDQGSPGNMYLQGLNIQARFNF